MVLCYAYSGTWAEVYFRAYLVRNRAQMLAEEDTMG
jgi:hypothetical protein